LRNASVEFKAAAAANEFSSVCASGRGLFAEGQADLRGHWGSQLRIRPISTALAEHLAGEVTTLATCWAITRRDGVLQGFTN
jgi:hypothetical protein